MRMEARGVWIHGQWLSLLCEWLTNALRRLVRLLISRSSLLMKLELRRLCVIVQRSLLKLGSQRAHCVILLRLLLLAIDWLLWVLAPSRLQR
jgi:hypothetical protein